MVMRTLLAFTLLVAPLGAQALCSGKSFMDRLTPSDQSDLDATVAGTPYANGLIWKATKGDAAINVVGTMHIYDTRLDAVFSRVAPLVATADQILVEATAKEEMAMQQALSDDPSIYLITDGPTLPELLGPETWEDVREAAMARDIPPFMVAQFQPWYLSLALAIPPCAMPDIAAGRRGLDHMIIDAAEANGLPVAAVEPWDTLISILNKSTPEENIEMLRLNLLAPELQSEMFVAMLDSYFSQDVATVWEASRLAMRYVPGLDPARAEALFDETEYEVLTLRNQNWLPVITGAAGSDQVILLAVGAAHLPGETGILRLLEQEGWAIAPVN